MQIHKKIAPPPSPRVKPRMSGSLFSVIGFDGNEIFIVWLYSQLLYIEVSPELSLNVHVSEKNIA